MNGPITQYQSTISIRLQIKVQTKCRRWVVLYLPLTDFRACRIFLPGSSNSRFALTPNYSSVWHYHDRLVGPSVILRTSPAAVSSAYKRLT